MDVFVMSHETAVTLGILYCEYGNKVLGSREVECNSLQ